MKPQSSEPVCKLCEKRGRTEPCDVVTLQYHRKIYYRTSTKSTTESPHTELLVWR
ncbi:hypothetical protein FKM82_028600 [Ascaphus truei]